MMKKTAFGLTGAAAAALLTVGTVAPAMADDGDSTSTNETTSSVTKILNGLDLKSMTPVDVSPEVNVGDVASGNAVGSGNDTSAPILSGNDTSVGNGNSSDIGTNVSDLVDGSVGDIGTNVSDLVDSILGD
jgi:hypothetical protein